MKEVFKELNKIFREADSIIDKADEIALLRSEITKNEDLIYFVNKVRERVQNEAKQAVIDNDGRGIVAMATGSGKSKVAIDLAKYYSKAKNAKMFDCNSLVVPTEKLRDENWKEEFEKWKAAKIFDNTERLCYASASKFENFNINLLILDEGHNLTELSSEIFVNNNVENVVILTATLPTSNEKKELFDRLGIPLVYHLTLDIAVKLGFVAPYEITVVYTHLDEINKNIISGTKDKPFYQTESEKYKYLSKVFDNSPKYSQERFRATMNRMRFIYNLKSKTDVAKYILQKSIPETNRTLIFCGSIEQANELNPNRFHSKTTDTAYNRFKKDEIKRLSCVQAINEGHNFIGLDDALVCQLNSKEKDIVQRIGRIVRYRPGHVAQIWIVVCKGTQDEEWAKTALENFDQSKIKHISFESLKKEKLCH